jgi:phosphate transport system protein
MNEMTDGHTVRAYNDEMNHLHGIVLEIGRLARRQIRDAVQTLEDEDLDEAREVILRDREINDLDIKADDEIVRIIARRQPVARDLRKIITVGKIVSDLERVGDQARKIARLTLHFYEGNGVPPNQQLLSDIPKIAGFVDSLVGESVEAFDELDLGKACDVIQQASRLEDEFRAALRRLSTYVMEDARSVGMAADVVLGLRALERIGGHAKNIAGYVVFLVKGKDVRHESLEVVRSELLAGKS